MFWYPCAPFLKIRKIVISFKKINFLQFLFFYQNVLDFREFSTDLVNFSMKARKVRGYFSVLFKSFSRPTQRETTQAQL